MSPKRPYTPPAIFRVELTPDQAILSACSLTTTSASTGMPGYCRTGQCKSFHRMVGADSSSRPS